MSKVVRFLNEWIDKSISTCRMRRKTWDLRGIRKIPIYFVCIIERLLLLITGDSKGKELFNEYLDNGRIIEIKPLSDISKCVRFYLPYLRYDKYLEGDLIQKEIYRYGSFYENTLLDYLMDKKYLPKGSNIMDWGSNIGNHTLYFATVVEANHIWCFEPVKSTFEILKRNIEINNLQERVSIYNVGLGEKYSKASIGHKDEENCGGTSIKENGEGDLVIESIDSMAIDDKIDFIKIDVEGFEYHALIGAANLIKKNRPIMFIEIAENNLELVDDLLNEWGYKAQEEFAGYNYIYKYISI